MKYSEVIEKKDLLKKKKEEVEKNIFNVIETNKQIITAKKVKIIENNLSINKKLFDIAELIRNPHLHRVINKNTV